MATGGSRAHQHSAAPAFMPHSKVTPQAGQMVAPAGGSPPFGDGPAVPPLSLTVTFAPSHA
jgi:hypothetical protein